MYNSIGQMRFANQPSWQSGVPSHPVGCCGPQHLLTSRGIIMQRNGHSGMFDGWLGQKRCLLQWEGPIITGLHAHTADEIPYLFAGKPPFHRTINTHRKLCFSGKPLHPVCLLGALPMGESCRNDPYLSGGAKLRHKHPPSILHWFIYPIGCHRGIDKTREHHSGEECSAEAVEQSDRMAPTGTSSS